MNNLKTVCMNDQRGRVAVTDLLKLLDKLEIKSADPMFLYGGSAARINTVMQMLGAGLISQVEARKMLGFTA